MTKITRAEIEERIRFDQEDFDYYVRQGEATNARACEIRLEAMRAQLSRASDETERCARLCEMRGDISRASAKKIREAGSYTTRCIWPLFEKRTFVLPKWEARARDLEAIGKAFDVVADCIRMGYDPREVTSNPAEQIKRDPDCIYPRCLVHGTENTFRGSQCVCDQKLRAARC